jgi:hypothetical protein
MEEVISRRRRGEELSPGLAKLMANPRTPIDSLTPISDRIAELFPNGLAEKNIVTDPTQVSIVTQHRGREVLVLATPARLLPKDENEPAKVARRGYTISPSRSLVMFLRDDTGEVLAKIGPRLFPKIGLDVVERGKVNKALYAVKGRVDRNFNMVWIDNVRYLGDME